MFLWSAPPPPPLPSHWRLISSQFSIFPLLYYVGGDRSPKILPPPSTGNKKWPVPNILSFHIRYQIIDLTGSGLSKRSSLLWCHGTGMAPLPLITKTLWMKKLPTVIQKERNIKRLWARKQLAANIMMVRPWCCLATKASLSLIIAQRIL